MRTAGTITVTGAYGAGNIGDEAILAGILHILRQDLPAYDLQVLSHSPAATTSLHGVPAAHALPGGIRSLLKLREARASLSATKLVCIGGGGILYDSDFSGGANPIRVWWLRTELLRRWHVPYAFLAVGAGPVRRRRSTWMLRRMLEGARLVTVRDAASAKLLREIAPRVSVVQIPDPAFALPPIAPVAQRATIVCARRWYASDTAEGQALTRALVDGLQPLAAEGEPVHFLPLTSNEEGDVAFAKELADGVGFGAIALETPASPRAALELFARARTVVSMRLHGVILGAVAGRPVVPISYSPKVAAIASELGLTSLSAATLTGEQIVEAIGAPHNPGAKAGELGMRFRLRARELIEEALASRAS